jgi:hypothetical protein
MGNCMFCGEPAGWLKTAHSTCRQDNDAARTAIVRTIATWLPAHPDATDFSPLVQQLRQIANSGHISEEIARVLLGTGLCSALEAFLEDGVLSKLEEDNFFGAAEALGFDGADLSRLPKMRRLYGAGLIRRVIEDEPWESPLNPADFGLILKRAEQLLWVEPKVTLREPKVSRTYMGASAGVSIRLARGVYYRVGQFKGHPIDRTQIVEIASGTLALTNQQLYFLSPIRGFKISYRKLVSVTPFEDGVGLLRDSVVAKPQYLQGADGWLLYNLIMNFAERDRTV